MPAIHIPDPLPPAITPPRTVIEFLIDQDLEEYGETGLIARTWHWVLHGSGPGPISHMDWSQLRADDHARPLVLRRGEARPVTRRPESPELPESKPVSEMTPEERREYARLLGRATRKMLAELNRPKRERKLRRDLAKPRNRAEMEIFCADFRTAEPDSRQPDDS